MFDTVALNVGDTVYQHDDEGNIYELCITGVTFIYDTDGVAFDQTAIGECIFLSAEDAERDYRKKATQRRHNGQRYYY